MLKAKIVTDKTTVDQSPEVSASAYRRFTSLFTLLRSTAMHYRTDGWVEGGGGGVRKEGMRDMGWWRGWVKGREGRQESQWHTGNMFKGPDRQRNNRRIVLLLELNI